MTIGSASSLDRQGKLLVAYSNDDGSTIGVEFAATTQKVATAVFGICASTLGESTGRLVSTAASSDTLINPSDGGDNMETRIAVLEADVAHIKKDVSNLAIDHKKSASDISDIRRDVAVVLQKMVDIDEKLSKKPSISEMTTAITSAVNKQIVWTIITALGVLGLAKWMF